MNMKVAVIGGGIFGVTAAFTLAQNNEVDLFEKKNVEKIMKNFSKNKKCEVMTLSTFKEDSVSKIKAKLLNYVS